MKHLPQHFILLHLLTIAMSAYSQGNPIIWKLNSSAKIGGISPVVVGGPEHDKDDGITSFYFNGESDGIILPVNPVHKLKKFTVEVLFKPSSEGNREQRFVHFQDKSGNRGLVEVRLENGEWWLDTYLHVGKTDKGLTLVDRTQRHPCDKWYWAALVYDGKIMSHYLNADEELSGEINFGPMESGIISIGVRLNQVYWFKGNISEIRVHSQPLKVEQLQKIEK
jgi:hypothetical protein